MNRQFLKDTIEIDNQTIYPATNSFSALAAGDWRVQNGIDYIFSLLLLSLFFKIYYHLIFSFTFGFLQSFTRSLPKTLLLLNILDAMRLR